MELLDRALQRDILVKLAASYPDSAQPTQLGFVDDEPRWIVNTMYLHEHGLVAARHAEMMSTGYSVHLAKITAKGLDFLQDDGGLTAILGVVTVRLEAETIKALLAHRVDASALPEPEKSRIKSALQTMGSEALKETTKRLVELALDRAPDALRLLQTLPG